MTRSEEQDRYCLQGGRGVIVSSKGPKIDKNLVLMYPSGEIRRIVCYDICSLHRVTASAQNFEAPTERVRHLDASQPSEASFCYYLFQERAYCSTRLIHLYSKSP